MQLLPDHLPEDIDQLRAMVIERDALIKARDTALKTSRLEIEKIKIELMRLKRMKFGPSSEQLDRRIGQLELLLEDIEVGQSEDAPQIAEPAPLPIKNPNPFASPCPIICRGKINCMSQPVSARNAAGVCALWART